MNLYLLRHAWAGHFGDPEWADDCERPLTDKGVKRFAEVAGRLVERGVRPSLVATSPLVRCRQTAEILVDALGGGVELVEKLELQPGSDLETMVAWTDQLTDEHGEIAWVGHAPDVGRMVATLIGQSGGWIRLSKGATAAVRFYDRLEVGGGELRWLVTAKLLGC
ncbi:MAG: phosphohistidine phosphatase SixA [Pirellulales bacterium]|nr:phosphohistidine phosphatase SixA [Pirellulales bacterium]